MSGPLCRTCGKAIPKRVETLWFGMGDVQRERYPANNFADMPADKASAQRFTTGRIVAVRYSVRDGVRYVCQASAWDGASYRSAYFCSDNHARDFGLACAAMVADDGTSPRYAMPAYWQALKR